MVYRAFDLAFWFFFRAIFDYIDVFDGSTTHRMWPVSLPSAMHNIQSIMITENCFYFWTFEPNEPNRSSTRQKHHHQQQLQQLWQQQQQKMYAY